MSNAKERMLSSSVGGGSGSEGADQTNSDFVEASNLADEARHE
jgi:hypothetical protein